MVICVRRKFGWRMWHLRCSSFLILGNGLIFQGHPRPTNEVGTWNLMWSIMQYSCAFDFCEYIGHMHPIISHPSNQKKLFRRTGQYGMGTKPGFDLFWVRAGQALGQIPRWFFFSSPEYRIWIHPIGAPKMNISEISKSRFLEVAPSSILA